MASVSGLSKEHRIQARDRAVQAAFLGYKNRSNIHYTQGKSRWQGIAKSLKSTAGRYPNWADCSAFVTWCLWNGLKVLYGVRDTVNGTSWIGGGFTGTMLHHGKRVLHQGNWLRADAVIYGNGGTGEHAAILVGKRADGKWMVISFGSEAGPLYLPYDYRKDIMQVRRYI